jgi:RteC protein
MDTKTVVVRLALDGRLIVESFGQEEGVAGCGQRGPVAITEKRYRWKGTDAQLVELIYALAWREIIDVDGKPADIKDVARLFGYFFGREVPHVYYTGMENQRRKKDKVAFLNSLIRVMMEGE